MAVAPQLPQEAQHYADMYHLGQPQSVYQVRFRDGIILGMISLLLAVLFGAVVLSGGLSGIPVVAMPLLTLLCGAGAVYYLIAYPLRYRSWRIYECAEGFVLLKGSEVIPCRWDEIACIWQRIVAYYSRGAYTGSSFKYIIQRADGGQIILTQLFHRIYRLGERIQLELQTRLVPQALAAVKEGQTLPFGPFSLSQQGLTTPKGVIPWNEVQQVRTQFNWVTIERRGQRPDASAGRVDTVPNLQVFLTVADKVAHGLG
jgi:hypothetical protein